MLSRSNPHYEVGFCFFRSLAGSHLVIFKQLTCLRTCQLNQIKFYQTALMCSLVSVFDGCTCQLVPFAYLVLLNVNFVSMHILVCLFCCFTSQVNSFGHGWTVSSPYHTFFWASLNKWLHVTSMVDHRYHTKFLAANIFD